MISTSPVLSVPFALIMVLAAASDLRTRRIPNVLTVAGVIVAPILWAVLGGAAAAGASVAGGAIALALGMILFTLGALGGGDAKLLAVTGAFLGPSRLVGALLAIGITGGLLALIVAFARGQLSWTIARTWNFALRLVTQGKKGVASYVDAPGALTIPYGVAISAGSLLTWFGLVSGVLAP